MIRTLLATTAMAALLSTGAFAQEATTPAPAPPATENMAPAAPVKAADGHLATNIIGETVYNGTSDTAENIGDVNDIVIDPKGQVESIVIGVGGFLGIGEKDVTVNYSDVNWAEKNGDRWIVVAATKDQLNAQPAFDRKAYDPAPAATTASDGSAPADNMAAAPAAPADNSATATDKTKTAAIDKSTLTEVPVGEIRSEDLVGTTVYGADDANVGEIGDVVVSGDGKVDAVIVDVGGFLGIGEKEVAIGMDKLSFMTDKDGNKYLYTNFTKAQLDAAAAYDKATYAEKRNDQRLTVR